MAVVGGENAIDTFTGLLKDTYADGLVDVRPDGTYLYKDMPFVSADKQNGNLYHQPVVLTHEHGFTYRTSAQGAFAINGAVAAVSKDATIRGVQILLESQIDYETIHRAMAPGKTSFVKATKYLMENMMKSFYKRLEIEHLYGGTGSVYCGLCQVGSLSATGSATRTVTVKAGHWAPGIWAGSEGAVVEIFDNDGTGSVAGTERFTSDTVTIQSVDFAAKTVTLATTGSNLDAMAADDFIYFKDAKTYGMTGLVTILANTGSLFGIDAAAYNLWAGNEHAVGSLPLTFSELIKGHNPAVGRGLMDDVLVHVNPGGWTDAMLDQAALRRYDASFSSSKAKNGTKALRFDSQFGSIELKSNIFIKEGLALSVPKKYAIRVGSTDLTFGAPGLGSGEMVYHLPSNAGVGVRAYANMAPFVSAPAKGTLFTGISNT